MPKTIEELDAAAAAARATYRDAAAAISKLPATTLRHAIATLRLEAGRDELVAAGGRLSREARDAIEDSHNQLIADDGIARTAPSVLRELLVKAEAAEQRAVAEWMRAAQRRMEEITFEIGRGPLFQAAEKHLGEVNDLWREAYRRASALGIGHDAQAVRTWLDARGAVGVPVVEVASAEVLISGISSYRSWLFKWFVKGMKNGNGNGHHGGA